MYVLQKITILGNTNKFSKLKALKLIINTLRYFYTFIFIKPMIFMSYINKHYIFL